MSKIQDLEIEVAKQQSRADTWEKAYFLLVRGKNVNDNTVSKKPFSISHVVEEEARATNFVNNVLMPELQKRVDENPPRPIMEGKSGEELIQAQGVWMAWLGKIIWELVKDEALVFIAKTFEEIKEKGADWAKQGAVWVLNNFQQWIFEKYQQAHNEEERQIVKDKILENYPDTELAKRIQN